MQFVEEIHWSDGATMVDLLATTLVVYVIFDAELTLHHQTTSLC